MSQLFQQLVDLRFEVQDGGKARKHRYTIYDRLYEKIIAKFDDRELAEASLKDIKARALGELNREYSEPELSVA
jgi:hypothetical protein